MSNVKEGLKYSKDHEWVEVLDNKVKIGITDYAQHSLGDVIFVELPEVEDELSVGDTLASAESVKAVSEIFTNVAGKIIEVNEALEDSPELVNQDAYGEGWIAIIELNDVADLDQLLSSEEYEAYLKEIE